MANDSNPNFLYRNTTPPGGAPRFESVGLIAGVAVNGEARAQAGMGADAGDYDGDGQVDFTLTAFAHDRNTIYRNVGSGSFEDASATAGLATSTFTRMGWGTAFLDADLDGRLDLVVANGHIFPDVDRFPALDETYAQASQLLLNQGGTFRDVSAGTGRGLQTPRVSRGLAVGDLDDDGDPDVVLSNMDAPPALLENRQRTGRHWIAFRFTAPAGNRLAIGATVTVTSGGRTQTREVRSGGSYLSQSRSAAAVRARRRGGSGVGRGADAGRRPLVVAGSAGGPPAHARADRDRPPMTCARLRLVAVAGLLSLSVGVAAQAPSGAVYRPALKPPEFLEPFAPKVDAGHDAFVDEPIAKAIEAQLRRFGDALKADRRRPRPRHPGCWPPARAAARSSHPNGRPATRRCTCSAGAVPPRRTSTRAASPPSCAA